MNNNLVQLCPEIFLSHISGQDVTWNKTIIPVTGSGRGSLQSLQTQPQWLSYAINKCAFHGATARPSWRRLCKPGNINRLLQGAVGSTQAWPAHNSRHQLFALWTWYTRYRYQIGLALLIVYWFLYGFCLLEIEYLLIISSVRYIYR